LRALIRFANKSIQLPLTQKVVSPKVTPES
jgi:hypothetical protein